MIQIINGQRKYLPDWMEIENECFSPAWSEQSMSDELQAEGGVFKIALAEDKAVGFCALRVLSDESELYQIAVSDAYRRQGIGRMLLDDAVSTVKQASVKKMFLEVRASNKPAVRLYEKCGFTLIATRKGYYDCPKEDALIMQLEI